MALAFNLSGINSVYVAARQNDRQTIVFEVCNGRGIFVFMMFFSEEDTSKDELFLYLARTRRMIKLKMYGRHEIDESHRNSFVVYLNDANQKFIREELGLEPGSGGIAFDFDRFLAALNADIPQQLNLAELQANCKIYITAFRDPALRHVVDDQKKIYLIGPKKLPPEQNPREKTLRKLYLYVDADVDVLEQFIAELKKRRMTLAWTDEPERATKDIRQLLSQM